MATDQSTKNLFKRAIKTCAFIFVCALIAILFINRYRVYKAEIYKPEFDTRRVVKLVNDNRQENGLPALAVSPKLTEAAQLKARDMFTKQYFSHRDPRGRRADYLLKKIGYEFTIAGENLSREFYSPEGVTKNWMDSPGHRANIIDPEYKEIGIHALGGKLFGQDTVLVVAIFAAPK